MSQYPGALDMFVDRSRVFIDHNDHKWIVVHKTAGFHTIEQLGAYFATTVEETSSHFGVGLDGRIAQFVLLEDGAAANCCLSGASLNSSFPRDNMNFYTISIEHIDPALDNSTPPTVEQLNASFALISWLCDRYTIPKSLDPDGSQGGGILRHRDIDPVNRALCPNVYPLEQLIHFLQTGGYPTLHSLEDSGMFTPLSHDFSLYFHQVDENHWQCKRTGKVIQSGILAFYRGLTLDGQTLPILGLPLSNEHPVPLPGRGTITVQDFERGRLAFDPKHLEDSQPGCTDVYLLKTGALPAA
jgi:N-acetyl-anhydromuramyl-L-alanine amidase AmpD